VVPSWCFEYNKSKFEEEKILVALKGIKETAEQNETLGSSYLYIC
jgi:hypothetical protein